MTAGYSVPIQSLNNPQRDHLTDLECLATPSLVLVVRFLCDVGLGSGQFLNFAYDHSLSIHNPRSLH